MGKFLLAFFYHNSRQERSVNRRVADSRHHVGDTANMVKVAVGDNNGADFGLLFFQIGWVGDNIIHTRRFFARKS